MLSLCYKPTTGPTMQSAMQAAMDGIVPDTGPLPGLAVSRVGFVCGAIWFAIAVDRTVVAVQ